MATHSPGTFPWMVSTQSEEDCSRLYSILTDLALWSWLKEHPDYEAQLTTLSPLPPELQTLQARFLQGGTGADNRRYISAMHHMYRIAQMGWEGYIQDIRSSLYIVTGNTSPSSSFGWGDEVRRKAIELYGHDSPSVQVKVLNLIHK